MNQADKQEALRLIEEIATHAYTSSDFADRAKQCADLRALIERQDDADGEMWRFCVMHGFPANVETSAVGFSCWLQPIPSAAGPSHPYSKHGSTPAEAVQAAMAAMKEKA